MWPSLLQVGLVFIWIDRRFHVGLICESSENVDADHLERLREHQIGVQLCITLLQTIDQFDKGIFFGVFHVYVLLLVSEIELLVADADFSSEQVLP